MRKITLKLEGHADDINAVCFADPVSTNVLFSGSDDSVVKVWDRRSMAGGREAGCLVGHMEGITFVSSKGDGRYVITNGKDQTLKLWDIRMMMERVEFDKMVRKDYNSGFDYRWMVPSLLVFGDFVVFPSTIVYDICLYAPYSSPPSVSFFLLFAAHLTL